MDGKTNDNEAVDASGRIATSHADAGNAEARAIANAIITCVISDIRS